MDFLQLCQRVNDFSGLQGTLSSITGVIAGTHQALLVEAVRKSWIELQTYRKDFKFLRSTIDLQLTAGKDLYTIDDIFTDPSLFKSWLAGSFLYNFKPLTFVDYDSWVTIAEHTPAPPTSFTIRPQDNAVIFNTLDGDYTVTLHFMVGIQKLVNNSDVPLLPAHLHYLIIYGGVMEMAIFTGEMNIYNRYALLHSQMLGSLLRSEVPHTRVRFSPIA